MAACLACYVCRLCCLLVVKLVYRSLYPRVNPRTFIVLYSPRSARSLGHTGWKIPLAAHALRPISVGWKILLQARGFLSFRKS